MHISPFQATPKMCLRALEARNNASNSVRIASYVRVLQEQDNVVVGIWG